MRHGLRNSYVGKRLPTDPEWKFFGDLPPLSGEPACVEADPALFDSIEKSDHVKAAVEYCFQCPVRRSCAIRRKVMADHLPARCGPEGTWAGMLFNTKGGRVPVSRKVYEEYARNYAFDDLIR